MPEWLNITIRSVAAVLYLFLLTRVIGKRQLSQITFFEYIVGITIGSIAGFIATDMDGPVLHGFLALTIFALFPVLIGWLQLKSKTIRNVVDGNATVLIKDGKILEDNLKKERITTEELMEQLRMKNAFKVADVEFAVMEPNGSVSVLLKSENQPLTPKHLGLSVAPVKEPQAVIMDGVIMDEPLATIGFNRKWLKTELEKQGVALENVFLGQVDDNGQLFLDLYDDKIQVPAPQTVKLTYATLKKCQADLELYALSAQNEETKNMYELEASRLKKVVENVTPLMTR
ncbi:DUF421 domain-containing protein [Effusibacillus lacus]|uniref:Membrane protein n=1 Tax=Effusibacillus lacus TaxID=1348429 RepID=A0A292YJ44_9BACL|nr:DUF421 domain-containing protein [Effusibacillus lacus]TCS69409.1 uncharacterized membrane protein YcaP (DUF421 family) [Effusibacillus lacus]GAX89176.1 membrane protein [Effusibacillus lacus]